MPSLENSASRSAARLAGLGIVGRVCPPGRIGHLTAGVRWASRPPRILHRVAAPLPMIKAPMAATEVARPFHRPGWVFEEKLDGWRVLAFKNADGVRLVSRNGRDLTRRFPELTAAVAEPEDGTVAMRPEGGGSSMLILNGPAQQCWPPLHRAAPSGRRSGQRGVPADLRLTVNR